MPKAARSIGPITEPTRSNAIKSGDISTARKNQDHITDLADLFYFQLESWQGGGKYVFQKRRIFSTTAVSSPSHSLTEADVEKLELNGS